MLSLGLRLNESSGAGGVLLGGGYWTYYSDYWTFEGDFWSYH